MAETGTYIFARSTLPDNMRVYLLEIPPATANHTRFFDTTRSLIVIVVLEELSDSLADVTTAARIGASWYISVRKRVSLGITMS